MLCNPMPFAMEEACWIKSEVEASQSMLVATLTQLDCNASLTTVAVRTTTDAEQESGCDVKIKSALCES